MGPLQALFSGSPLTGQLPLTVEFSSDSTGDIDNFTWDFGDGDTSFEINPTHTYETAGVYTVTLTISSNKVQDQLTRASYRSPWQLPKL